MAPSKRPLVIELEPGHKLPSGQVRDHEGARHPFTGWLGLAAALGRGLRASAADPEQALPTHARTEQRPTGNRSIDCTTEQRCD